jgi:hypothetical protein
MVELLKPCLILYALLTKGCLFCNIKLVHMLVQFELYMTWFLLFCLQRPREDVTHIDSSGVLRTPAVYIFPLRRLNQAIYLLHT